MRSLKPEIEGMKVFLKYFVFGIIPCVVAACAIVSVFGTDHVAAKIGLVLLIVPALICFLSGVGKSNAAYLKELEASVPGRKE